MNVQRDWSKQMNETLTSNEASEDLHVQSKKQDTEIERST